VVREKNEYDITFGTVERGGIRYEFETDKIVFKMFL
jgi:hypothetical protein